MALNHDHRRMSVEDFLVWHEKQPEKWELIEGEPVRRTRTRGKFGGARKRAISFGADELDPKDMEIYKRGNSFSKEGACENSS